MKENETIQDKNRVILTGKLEKIEAGTTTQGFPFCNISVRCTGLKYTDFIPCTVYGGTASRLIEQAKVGDSVTVNGRVRVKEYSDRNRQGSRSFLSIVVTSVKKTI